MKVDIEGLKRWRAHIASLAPDQINMRWWRKKARGLKVSECNSVGCVTGHCASLYSAEELKPITFDFHNNSIIDFEKVAELIGIKHETNLWNFLFSHKWSEVVMVSQHADALHRMDYIIKNNKPPKQWREHYRQTLKLIKDLTISK